MADFWKGKSVFVTGGNGFLGSHLVSSLIARGAKTTVLIYEENPGGVFEEKKLEKHVTIVRGDIRNLALLEEIIRWHKVEIVFHLAAQAIVDHAIDDPLDTFETNIQGTWNILEACKRNPSVKEIIVASSDKAYGHHDELPYGEHTHYLKAAYPYEVSKASADLITQTFAKTFRVPASITRCGNLYGPGDLKMNRIVPRTISELCAKRPPIIRDTGSSLRDYLYVGDAVDGYMMLAEQMDPSMYGEAFNFSTNNPLSVAEVIKVISREMKQRIEPKIVKTHGMEIPKQYASYEKAKRILGWTPRHELVQGLRKTIPWYVRYLQTHQARTKHSAAHSRKLVQK